MRDTIHRQTTATGTIGKKRTAGTRRPAAAGRIGKRRTAGARTPAATTWTIAKAMTVMAGRLASAAPGAVAAIVVIAALLLPPAGATAQRAVTGDTLSLRECLDLAATRNLSLLRQEERIAAATAAADVTRAAGWPTIAFSSGASYVSELAEFDAGDMIPGAGGGMEVGARDQYDVAASLSVPLFTGFRTRNAVRAAEERLLQAGAETEAIRHGVLLGVHRLYRALQGNLLERETLASSERRIESHLRRSRRLLEQGQATAFDTLETANRLLETKTARARLAHRYRATAAELAALLDLPAVEVVRPAAAEDALLPDLAPPEEHVAAALAARPELVLRDHLIREREHLRRAAASAWWPQVTAGASWHYARPGVNFFADEWMDYYSLQVTLGWEIWNRGRRGNEVRRLDHLERLSRIERESAALDIRAEVVAAWETVAGAREELVLQRRLVEQERDRYRIAFERFGQGLATSTDLRDAEESLTAAELRLRRDRIELLAGRAALARATGRIGEEAGR